MVPVRFRCILLALLTTGRAATAQEYAIQVTENRLPGQPLYVEVYPADARSWQGEPSAQLRFTLPDTPTGRFPLSLPAGNYAVRAFVDLNDNQMLDTLESGRPAEPYSTSIGSGRKRPSPGFARSVRTLSAQTPVIELQLRYPKHTDGTTEQKKAGSGASPPP